MRGLFSTLARETKGIAVDDINPFLNTLFGGMRSKSGLAVTVDSALDATVVLAVARVLAEGVAMLPLKIFDIDDAKGTKKPDVKNPLYMMLARRPNDWMTSFEFRETLMFHAALTGDGFAYIGRGLKNMPVELIPLVPAGMSVYQDSNWNIKYRYTDKRGTMEFDRENIFHLRGPSWNGYTGLEIIKRAREAIGLALATEETHASLHKNGAQPGGILAIKGKLDKGARDRLKEAWESFQGSIADRFKTAVFDADATWTPLGMKGVDAEHLATRGFQIEEVCRAFRVFPQMVMHTDKTSTFASAESFFLAHVTHSLMPWITRWEHTIERDLLNNDPSKIAKFNVAALLRGDSTARATFYEKALGGARGETAYMTRNEVRELEDLDPIEGGDVLPVPTNPTPAPVITGPPADAVQNGNPDIEKKVGRVLSSMNEKRIRNASSELDAVLTSLPTD